MSNDNSNGRPVPAQDQWTVQDLNYQIYNNQRFFQITSVPIGTNITEQEQSWMKPFNLYRTVYRILYAIRFFFYIIAFGSENYQFIQDDSASVAKYLSSYGNSSQQTLITIVILTQGLITYLQRKFNEKMNKNKSVDLLQDFLIDILKILRTVLMFIVSFIVLNQDLVKNLHNQVSLIAIFGSAVSLLFQKIVKIMFFQFIDQHATVIKKKLIQKKLDIK